MGGVGSTRENLKVAIEGETYEYTEMYPKFAEEARREGREDVARTFEAFAKAERAHAERFKAALEKLG